MGRGSHLLLFFLQSRHSETIVAGCIYSQALARKLSERLVPRGVGAGIRKNLESRINVLERIVEVERISNGESMNEKGFWN